MRDSFEHLELWKRHALELNRRGVHCFVIELVAMQPHSIARLPDPD